MAGVTVRLFSRPEDHSAKTAYESHPWTLYATSTETTVTMDKLKGRCHVALNNDIKTGVLHLPQYIISSTRACRCFSCLGVLRVLAISHCTVNLWW